MNTWGDIIVSFEFKMQSQKTYLDNDFHEILLSNNILAVDDLFQDAREDGLLVHFQVDPIQLTKSDQIGSNEDAQFTSLHFALFPIP